MTWLRGAGHARGGAGRGHRHRLRLTPRPPWVTSGGRPPSGDRSTARASSTWRRARPRAGTLSVDGEEAERRTVFGWANAFDLPRGGHGDPQLRHGRSPAGSADRRPGRRSGSSSSPGCAVRPGPARRREAPLVTFSRWPAVVILAGLLVGAWVVDRDHERDQSVRSTRPRRPLEAAGVPAGQRARGRPDQHLVLRRRHGDRRTVAPTRRSSWPTPPTVSSTAQLTIFPAIPSQRGARRAELSGSPDTDHAHGHHHDGAPTTTATTPDPPTTTSRPAAPLTEVRSPWT